MKDKIIKAVAKDETIRIIAATTTDLLNHVQKTHELNEFTTVAFGRLMTCSAMISATNKTKSDSIIIRFDGNGSIGSMSTITKGDGTLKGFISNPNAQCEKLSDLIGEGFLVLTKDLGLKNPYTSKVPLYKSDVYNDLAYYYTLSEQTPTAICVGMDLNDDFSIKHSAGLMVQMLPGADEMVSDIVSYRFEDMGSLTDQLKAGKTIYDVLNFMFDDMDLRILEEREVEYRCDCSSDKVERALISLGSAELQNIINDGKEETVVCDYCKTEYKFTLEDLEQIYNKLQKNS